MIGLDVSAEFAAARRRLQLTERELEPAAARALNRTITTVRAAGVQELRPLYPGMSAGDLRVRMKLMNARREALVALIKFSGRRIGAYGKFGMRAQGRFGIKFGKAPWRVEDLAGDVVSAEMLGRAFRNRLSRGGRATAFARWTQRRLPIAVLMAPGVARALVEKKIGPTLTALASRRFGEAFAQELRFALSKRS